MYRNVPIGCDKCYTPTWRLPGSMGPDSKPGSDWTPPPLDWRFST